MQQSDWKAYIWRLDEWKRVTTGISVMEHIQAGASWTDKEINLALRPSTRQEIPTEPARSTPTVSEPATASKAPTMETQTSSPLSIPAHISNDIDRKLIRELQITLSSLADAAAEDAKEPGLPKSIKKTRQAYIRAIDELRRRTDPSSTPQRATKFENWRNLELIQEVREVEMMVIMAPLLPKKLDCQMHIWKLVSGKVPSLDAPSDESLGFMEEFDKHIETRKRFDAWKEKGSKEPRQTRQMDPDCAPQ